MTSSTDIMNMELKYKRKGRIFFIPSPEYLQGAFDEYIRYRYANSHIMETENIMFMDGHVRKYPIYDRITTLKGFCNYTGMPYKTFYGYLTGKEGEEVKKVCERINVMLNF